MLHNVLAIFTFMGSSILRQDDAYSFQVISKIVDTIIPILVKVCIQHSQWHGCLTSPTHNCHSVSCPTYSDTIVLFCTVSRLVKA